MFANIIANLLGAVIFLFIFWRRLKEDYSSEIIYATGFNLLVGLGAGLTLSWILAKEWWFWFVFLGSVLGLTLGIWRFRLRAYEIIEAASIGLIVWLSLLFLWHAVSFANISSLIGFFVLIFLAGLFVFLETRYKRFSWYVSGRAGFSGLTIVGTFFLIRAIVASYLGNVLSLAGKWDGLVSAVVGFAAFLLVYNLSKSQT